MGSSIVLRQLCRGMCSAIGPADTRAAERAPRIAAAIDPHVEQRARRFGAARDSPWNLWLPNSQCCVAFRGPGHRVWDRQPEPASPSKRLSARHPAACPHAGFAVKAIVLAEGRNCSIKVASAYISKCRICSRHSISGGPPTLRVLELAPLINRVGNSVPHFVRQDIILGQVPHVN